MSSTEHHREAPPVAEEVHLPGPSFIPFVNAIGITLAVIGTTINWLFTIVGLAIFLFTTIRWVRDTRRDMNELPESGH